MAITLDNYKKTRCKNCGFVFTYYNREEGEIAKYVRIALSTFQPDKHSRKKFPIICPHCGYDIE